MLTKYGTDNIIIMLIASGLLIGIAIYINAVWIKYPVYVLGIILAFFTLWFFRDPNRIIPQKVKEDESYLIAPSDGKVVAIVDEFEKHYRNTDSKRISIFLSPIDVHVNRSPVQGVVEFYDYVPGQYLVAYHPKSSELNEHSRIGVKNKFGKVFFKQIVGVLARRIVCELKERDTVYAGEKFGMMKFGSRMDIAIDPNSEIFINEGDVVVGGETIIARLPRQF